ncbi:nuclear lim interactor-interacting protein [Pelomyxa schiedti]|nr:nuclear lim interactor-interacting protein [Pelomyxa schiedti]
MQHKMCEHRDVATTERLLHIDASLLASATNATATATAPRAPVHKTPRAACTPSGDGTHHRKRPRPTTPLSALAEEAAKLQQQSQQQQQQQQPQEMLMMLPQQQQQQQWQQQRGRPRTKTQRRDNNTQNHDHELRRNHAHNNANGNHGHVHNHGHNHRHHHQQQQQQYEDHQQQQQAISSQRNLCAEDSQNKNPASLCEVEDNDNDNESGGDADHVDSLSDSANSVADTDARDVHLGESRSEWSCQGHVQAEDFAEEEEEEEALPVRIVRNLLSDFNSTTTSITGTPVSAPPSSTDMTLRELVPPMAWIMDLFLPNSAEKTGKPGQNQTALALPPNAGIITSSSSEEEEEDEPEEDGMFYAATSSAEFIVDSDDDNTCRTPVLPHNDSSPSWEVGVSEVGYDVAGNYDLEWELPSFQCPSIASPTSFKRLDHWEIHCTQKQDPNLIKFLQLYPPPPMARLGFPAIPPKMPGSPKVTLVLDMDETLVHCSTQPLPPSITTAAPAFEFDLSIDGSGIASLITNVNTLQPQILEANSDSNITHVYVYTRPHLETFLREVAHLFEVVVFTASQRVYAETVVNNIDPDHEFIKHQVFRPHCVNAEGFLLKDLRVLNRDLTKTAIIDNSSYVYAYQVDNGIPITSWVGSTSDVELLTLLPFLRTLHSANDIRPLVCNKFHRKFFTSPCQPATPACVALSN